MSENQEVTAVDDSNESTASADPALPLSGQRLAPEQIAQIIEAALLAAEGPVTVDNLFRLFAVGELDEEAGRKQIRTAIEVLEDASAQRGVALQKVASGYRYQTRQELSPWVSRLWEEKPPRYTRALLETLALVAYKQPVTRGDIEQVRGVSVSQNIMRTLLERDWIRVVGQREAPGRPALYGTTKAFLDYFNLGKLDELPPLEKIKAMIEPALVVDEAETADVSANPEAQPEAESETETETETEAAIGTASSGDNSVDDADHAADHNAPAPNR